LRVRESAQTDVETHARLLSTSKLMNQVGRRTLEAFLTNRIYECNAEATGYFDGHSFHAIHQQNGRDSSWHRWIRAGRCCYVAYLWAHATMRDAQPCVVAMGKFMGGP
jgi:hypothetical protein